MSNLATVDTRPRNSRTLSSKILASHLDRLALVYVRQSSARQVEHNIESTQLQYQLVGRAEDLGWSRSRIEVIDDDLGVSGRSIEGRTGFQRLLAQVSLEHVGIVLGIEMSRLARSCRDWHHLLELCAMFGTLLGDADGVSDSQAILDRVLELRHRGHSAESIAAILNQDKYRATQGGAFTKPIVTSLLKRLRQSGHETNKQVNDYWKLTHLAMTLKIKKETLNTWRIRGWVQAMEHGGHWLLWADKDEIERLRKLATYRRKKFSKTPVELTTPKPRPAD